MASQFPETEARWIWGTAYQLLIYPAQPVYELVAELVYGVSPRATLLGTWEALRRYAV